MSIGGGNNRSDSASEILADLLAKLAQGLMIIGGITLLIGLGFSFYSVFAGADVTDAALKQGLKNVGLFTNLSLVGGIVFCLAASYLYWDEGWLGPTLLVSGIVFATSPVWMPAAGIGKADKELPAAAMRTLATAGMILLVFGVLLVVIDGIIRMRQRMEQGAKADQLKYGKGIKDVDEKQNVFLGKCWQLPFCRKFVREKCPIYHSRTTCWKELVGCMCEEKVIQMAMDGKPIPKDAILAANYIPRNNKLTIEQKKDRCRSCVIYNEHQKHKYRVAVPVTVIAFILVYLLLHGPIISVVGSMVGALDKFVNVATLGKVDSAAAKSGGAAFTEILGASLGVIGLTYTLKAIEYAIFRLKL
ncbi:MAG: hypothetical protein JST35_09030 [Armatimonadetes bacterium]|nr:hypothetical protein [Armatimonadota bacterium]